MITLPIFYLVSTVAIFALAWMKGGHDERRGVVFLLMAYVASLLTREVMFGRHPVAEIAIDAVLMAGFVWLAMRRDRWWTLLAAAAQLLTLTAHASFVLDPEISLRASVTARSVFGLLMLYCLLGGVAERWLAGERPAFPGWGGARVG